MKRDVFERIEKQLEPDDTLIESVINKAKSMEKAGTHPPKKGISMLCKIIGSSAAAVLLLIGVVSIINSKSGNIRPNIDTPDVISYNIATTSVTPEETSAVVTQNTTVSSKSNTTKKKAATLQTTTVVTTQTEPVTEPVVQDDGRSQWSPDPNRDYYGADSDGSAAALAAPTGDYRSFEKDGSTFNFACGNYGEIYENYTDGMNIPNNSYIGEYMATAAINSIYGDLLPATSGEIYSLKYIDPDYLAAVKFPYYNDDPRYYLFANTNKTYNSFSELLYALNIERCTFDGRAINKYNDTTQIIDNDSELVQQILSIDGSLTDTAYGEPSWRTYLDIPLYGASLSFTWYSDGYVTVNAFGSEVVYEIGSEMASQIINYIDNTGYIL